MDLPSNLEHMLEETRNNVHVMCLLLKIGDTLEVGTVFCLVGCSGERHIDVFPGNPLVEVIFDLKEGLWKNQYLNVIRKDSTYHCQYKSNGDNWNCVVLGELRVYNTVILFVFKPDLID
jgi:hypothetical protein